MQITKYNAFGYKLTKTEAKQGEIETDETNQHYDNTFLVSRPYDPNIVKDNITPKTVNNIYLVTKGLVRFVNLYSGATKDWNEGYCSLDDPIPLGLWASTQEIDSIVFVFTAHVNQDLTPVMPNVTTFRLNTGSSITTSGQTRIFLCDGELSINGTAVTGPKQLIISSGKTITATTNSYGFTFN